MSIKLTVMSLDFDAAEPPRTFEFEKPEVRIGRSNLNDVVLQRDEVSGQHAALRIVESDSERLLSIIDLGSSNGTAIESTPLQPNQEYALQSDDRVIIGTYIIKAELNQSANEAAESVDAIREFGNASHSEFQSNQRDSGSWMSPGEHSQSYHSQEADEGDLQETREIRPEEFRPPFPSESRSEYNRPEEPLAYSAPEAPLSQQVAPPSPSTPPTRTNIVEVNFEAIPLLPITGLISHHGKPLSNVLVIINGSERAQTDSEGRFLLEGFADGAPYSLDVQCEGFIFPDAPMEGVVNPENTVALEAVQLITVTGKVIQNGQGIAGVEIDGGPIGRAVTDHTGTYSFENVREDEQYSLTAVKDGYTFRMHG